MPSEIPEWQQSFHFPFPQPDCCDIRKHIHPEYRLKEKTYTDTARMNAHHHIISIGASDSGIDDIATFFDQKPLAGVAYVIIQHLPPDFRARLAEVLAKDLYLVISEAQNGVLVETDHVYIIPEGKSMSIRKGRLYITEKPYNPRLHNSTDSFFTSLAADQGEKAIGVILFEIGEDSLEGISAIRDAGGIVIARRQDAIHLAPAINEVDFVTEPALIPQIIEDYVMQSRKTLLDQNEEVTMEMIIDAIRENTTFDFSGYRLDILSHKTRKRALDQNFYSLADYLSFLKVTSTEMHSLSREFLTGGIAAPVNENTPNSPGTNPEPEIFGFKRDGDKLENKVTHEEQLMELEKELNELKARLSLVHKSDVSMNNLKVANALLRLANGRLRHDNSEMRSANHQLDAKNKKLTEANKELDNFVHLASHDLLAPLAHIEGSIALINEIGVTDTQLAEMIGIINASAKRFRALVEDMGNVAKAEHDLKSKEKVDIEEIIQSVLWPLETKIKQSHTQIIVSLRERSIYFSKKNLRSIVFNLISNSLKFNESLQPSILIITEKINGQVVLSVEDNGMGIPTPELEHVFKLYGRARYDIEGNGVGLYLTKRMIDASGGSLVVESTLGEGSKFTISFAAE